MNKIWSMTEAELIEYLMIQAQEQHDDDNCNQEDFNEGLEAAMTKDDHENWPDFYL